MDIKKNLFGIGALVFFAFVAIEANAQNQISNSDGAITQHMAFLNGHPDLFFRIRGFDLLNSKSSGKAVRAFQRAALFGDKPSQAVLAGVYWEGEGIERDRALAYVWMDLAAERGYPDFVAMREKFWGELSETERARALQEGQAIYTRYGDAVANPRLERELRRQRMQVVGSRTGFAGNAKITLPVPGWAGNSDGTPTLIIDGSQFYADKLWEPKQYQAWLDAQWKEPRSGRVEVGTLQADEKPAKTRIEKQKAKSGKP